jgi:hypothetical protein
MASKQSREKWWGTAAAAAAFAAAPGEFLGEDEPSPLPKPYCFKMASISSSTFTLGGGSAVVSLSHREKNTPKRRT